MVRDINKADRNYEIFAIRNLTDHLIATAPDSFSHRRGQYAQFGADIVISHYFAEALWVRLPAGLTRAWVVFILRLGSSTLGTLQFSLYHTGFKQSLHGLIAYGSLQVQDVFTGRINGLRKISLLF
jgi:hypothetical protein